VSMGSAGEPEISPNYREVDSSEPERLTHHPQKPRLSRSRTRFAAGFEEATLARTDRQSSGALGPHGYLPEDSHQHECQSQRGVRREPRQHQSNPPRISRTPVTATRRSGRGKDSGTIRIRSGRRLPQCADAVSKNMPASARRKEVHQPNATGIWK
jgi:hypothetical protein